MSHYYFQLDPLMNFDQYLFTRLFHHVLLRRILFLLLLVTTRLASAQTPGFLTRDGNVSLELADGKDQAITDRIAMVGLPPTANGNSHAAYRLPMTADCPSVFVVSSTDDADDATPGDGVCATSGGVCTLRAAIQEVTSTSCPGSFTISVTASGTINLTSALPDIVDDITFIGSGANNLTVRRSAGTFRIFNIPNNNTVRFDGFTIADGIVNGNGGGISNAGRLTVANCIISNNQSTTVSGSGRGGGIYNTNQLIITSTQFVSNSATTDGGAICNSGGSSTLTSCSLISNSANGGGAIYNSSSHTATIGSCVIESNTAISFGGGICNSGGTSSTLTSCSIASNQARYGGGIYNFRNTITLYNCVIQNNTADTNGGGGGLYNTEGSSTLLSCSLTSNESAANGGAIHNTNSHTAILSNCILQSNTATADGGGIYNSFSGTSSLMSCSLISNLATNGGGINGTNAISLDNCLVQSNMATADGGGVYSGAIRTISIVNVSFENNLANDQGGAFYLSSTTLVLTNASFRGNSATTAGSVFYINNGAVQLTNGVIFDNGLTNKVIGGRTIQATYSIFEQGTTAIIAHPSNLTINVSPFANPTGTQLNACAPAINRGDNSATGLTGITTDLAGNDRRFNNGVVDMGAYEFQDTPNSITITAPPVTTATAGVAFNQSFTATGGTLPYSFGRESGTLPVGLTLASNGTLSGTPTEGGSFTLTVRATDAAGCIDFATNYILDVACPSPVYTVTTTAESGPGSLRQAMLDIAAISCPGPFTISVTASGTINLTSILPTIADDITFLGPGASNLIVRRSSGSFRIFTISNNNVSFDGFTIADGSESTGGGIYNSGRLTITNCVIRNNQVTSYGAGIYNNRQLIIANTRISNNSCTNLIGGTGGGGIYSSGGSSTLTSCTLTANLGSHGGAIHTINSHTAILTNCVLQSNSATYNGGGGGAIYNSGGNSTLTSCSIANNRSVDYGGGIFNTNSHTLTMSNCLVENNIASVVGSGGGIYNNGGRSTLMSCTIRANRTYVGGGVSNTNNHTAILTNCVLQSNTATTSGGGVNSFGGSNTLTSCSISSNQSDLGGGIFNTSNNYVCILSNCVLQSNTATTSGGGIYNGTSGLCTAVNVSFENNQATSQGGAVYASSMLGLTNVSFRSNQAGSGTVFYINNGTIQLTNGVMFGNGQPNNAITNGSIQATYSLFEQNTSGITADPSNLTTILSPFAYSTGTQLNACTPAIDAGNNSATALTGISTDLAGNNRINNSVIDMGAYEFLGTPQSITFSNPTVTTGTVGVAFAQSFSATGSTEPYSFSLASGTLPTGLTLASSGILSGTPTQSGSFTVTVYVIDAGGCTDIGPRYVLDVTCPSPVYTVTTTAESGPGSLRQAMLDIASITCPGPFTINVTVSGTINLTSALPDIVDDITFIGPGAGSLTVRRSSGSFRIFTIPNNNTVSFDGFTIADGFVNDAGGGIYNEGRLTVTNCVIRNNRATTNGGGGGIINLNQLIVTSTLFASNSATNSTSGGAIYNYGGSSTLTSCTISNNLATITGGGIGSTVNHTVTLTNCVVQSNTVTGNSSAGGGLYNNGGISTLMSCTIANNQGSNGGGIGNASSHTITLTNCVLQSNTATSSSGGGGGLINTGGISTLTSCTLTGNQSTSVGGGVYNWLSHRATLINCVLERNVTTNSSGGGGGICTNGSSSTLINCSLNSNRVTGTGGAIYNTGSFTTMLSNCVLQSNTANSGGGIVNTNGSSRMTSCTFTANRSAGGGAIYNNSHMAVITNCVLQSNTATSFGGGLFGFNSSFTIANASIENNQSPDQGGAAYGISTTFLMTNASFRGNRASSGQVFYLSNSTAQLTNGVMFGNGQPEDAIANGTLQATYSLFEQNTAGVSSHSSNITTNVSPFASTIGTELAPCSQAIDAGTNSATGLAGITTDLAGNDRRFANGTVDMGAYEFQGAFAPPATFSVLGSGTATCATSPTITLAGSETGVSYQLQVNGSNIGTALAGTGTILSFGTQPQAGTYTVVATKASNSCTLVMPTSATVVSSTAVPEVSISASSSTLSCAVTSITLTAITSETALLWSNGATTTSITVNTADTYSVTVTNASNCTAIATQVVDSATATIATTNPAVNTAIVGSDFSQTFTSTSTGSSTRTYSLVSGTLPTGLTLASSGVLSGTPTQTGSFTSTVRATDANGCSGTGALYTLVVSTTATVITTTPTNISGLSATLGGSITDDGGATVTERGVVYVMGNGLPTTSNTKVVIGSGTGSFAQSVTGLTSGTEYSVRAYAINVAGTSYGGVESFTTYTAPPAPLVNTPANGSKLSDNTPTYSGTATANSSVTVFVGGSNIGQATAGAGGNWTFTPTVARPDGTYTVYAQTSLYGLSSPNSNSNTFGIDTTPPPGPVVLAPLNGASINDVTPTFLGTAEPTSSVTVLVDGSAVGTTTADASGNWNVTPVTQLSVGAHTVTARATDEAGNTGPNGNANTFTIDVTQPTVTITSSATNPTGTSPIPVSITFSKSVTDFVAEDISVSNGTVSALVGSGASYTAMISPSAAGLVSVSVAPDVAQDAIGNSNLASNVFSIQYQPIPTLTGFAANPATVCAGATVTFTATVGNVAGTYNYTLTNGSSTSTGSSAAAISQSWIASGSGSQSFTLTVEQGGQPRSETATLLVNTNPSLTVTASPSLTIAQGNTVTLTVSGGTSYTWTGNVQSATFTASPTTTTTYSVTGLNASGCTSVRSVTVVVNPIPCGPVIHVTESGSGLQDGSSWANSLPGTMLQAAINAAAGCGGARQVWVATGTYKPTTTTGPASRTISFSMANNVVIYGGFVGSETALSGRPAVNPVTGQPSSSTLSGEIGNLNSLTDNSEHVITNLPSFSLNSSAVLNGFVVANAYSLTKYGGGLNNELGNSPTIQQCVFLKNQAGLGGGMYNITGNPVLTDCVFQSNTAASFGGGVLSQADSHIQLTNCKFIQNISEGEGGGVFNEEGSIILTSCSFTGNIADQGAGIKTTECSVTVTGCSFVSNSAVDGTGGGMHNDVSALTFENNTLQNNSARSGGGLFMDEVIGSLTVKSCLFTGNRATNDGGGFTVKSSLQNLPVLVVNSSFVDNSCTGYGGAISCYSRNSLTLVNSSFQGNAAGTGMYDWGAVTDADGAYLINCVEYGNTYGSAFYDNFRAENCLLESTSYTNLLVGGTNNLTATGTPFASTTSNELAPCSPAIDAGTNSAPGLAGITTDLAGNPRRYQNGIVDIGAYEFQGAGLPTSFSVLGSGTATCAASPTITLSGSETGVSYQLRRDGVNSGTAVAGTGSVISFGTQLLSGTYTVLATRTNSCTAVLATSATVVSNTTSPALSLTPSSATLTCTSPTITLTATSGLTSYRFSSGQNGTSNTLLVTTANVYSVTATGANGCTALASTTIASSTAVPAVSINASSTLLSCTTPTVSLSAVGNGTVNWSTGSSTTAISVTAAGDYSVTLTNGSGCSAVAQVTIGGSTSAPSLSITPSSYTLTCSNPTVSLSAIGSGTVRWSTGATTPVLPVTVANVYSVTLTGSNSCTTVSSATVVSGTSAASVSISPTSGTLSCTNPTVSLSAIGSGTVLWSTGVSTTVISATAAGTYSVTLTNSNGCTATASATISGTALRTAVVTADGPIGCGRTSAQITIQATGATSFTLLGPSGYSAVNGTGVFSVTAGGSYTGLAGQFGGCVQSGTVVVSDGGLQPTASNFRASGALGAGSCTVRLLGTGTGNAFVMTGPGVDSPNGYVFSNVYRTVGTYSIEGRYVRQPGTYTLTVYSGSCSATYTTVVTGTACP